MNTRAWIAVETENKKGKKEVRCCYSHYDGYVEHHAPILLNHYNDKEKIEELISYGDILVLREDIDFCEVPKRYDRVFKTEIYKSSYALLQDFHKAVNTYIEYLYLYTYSGGWKVFKKHEDLKDAYKYVKKS